VQIAKRRCQENVDSAQKMVLRDHVIEPKFVEQARLLSMPSPHHCRIILRSFSQQESPFTTSRKPFFDSIDPFCRLAWPAEIVSSLGYSGR
jgi:hypothetical protein